MIKHLSLFNLKYLETDPKIDDILQMMFIRARELPEVARIRIFRQECQTNPYNYCIEVTFDSNDPSILLKYMNNTVHEKFCEEVWSKYVLNSLDINITQLY